MAALTTPLDARDPVARDVLRVAGARVDEVLAAVSHAVGPGVIVVGGELAEAGAAHVSNLVASTIDDGAPDGGVRAAVPRGDREPARYGTNAGNAGCVARTLVQTIGYFGRSLNYCVHST